MALQRSAIFLKAIVVLLASAPSGCSAAPAGGKPVQTFVGPDGALTQAAPAGPPAAAPPWVESRTGAATAAVAVDRQGQAAPASGQDVPAVLAAGGGQRLGPYPAQTYQAQPAPAAYTSPVPAAYPSPVPVTAGGLAPSPAFPPCLVPMWNEEEYVCKEHEDHERTSYLDSRHILRIEMPDGTKCTVTPPGKYSFWMASEVTEMTCKAAVWVDGKGKPITAIETKTAQWFLIASAVTAAVSVYLLYKMFYDTESSWYTWRLDMAVYWGFAKPAPVVEEVDTGGDTGPQGAINISISNSSGSQPAPQAQPK